MKYGNEQRGERSCRVELIRFRDVDFSVRDAGNRRRIYGSLRMDPEGWAAIVKPLTEEDLAAEDYPGKRIFGVLVDPLTESRHWCVDWYTPLEPKGTLIMIR